MKEHTDIEFLNPEKEPFELVPEERHSEHKNRNSKRAGFERLTGRILGYYFVFPSGYVYSC